MQRAIIAYSTTFWDSILSDIWLQDPFNFVGTMTECVSKVIVVCCDGTWCGEATDTDTNIKILADSIAASSNNDVVVRYFPGVGLAGSFEDYVINGAIANDIRNACIEVYKFIAENFEDSRIWMFGLSRGAYTVRSVAGMINNWGILKGKDGKIDVETLCDVVYSNYRNNDPEYET